MVRRLLLVVVVVMSCAAWAQDEKNDLGLTLGQASIRDREAASGQRVVFNNSVAFGANYARRLKGGYAVAFDLEFPFVAIPGHDITPAGSDSIVHVASLFVTPSLRVKFAPRLPISPWISGGLGFGWYEGSELLASGAANPDRNKVSAAAQFGAGVDVRTPLRILAPISLRGEFRDFYSFSNPSFNVPMRSDGQHNFVISGGFVLRF
ncbi:MAG: hypothetical protein AB7O65_03710 [Candidatus Korobacteraceae bacterium]